jgi:hypothetical protein
MSVISEISFVLFLIALGVTLYSCNLGLGRIFLPKCLLIVPFILLYCCIFVTISVLNSEITVRTDNVGQPKEYNNPRKTESRACIR